MSTRKKNTTKRAETRATETTPEPAASAPELTTDNEKELWAALENHPGSTAAELADAAGIAASTARHILTGWAKTGAAHRDRDPDNPRAAQRWTPTAPPDPAVPAAEPHPEPDAEPGSDTASTATESADDAPTPEPAPGTQAPPEPPAAGPTGGETTAPATDTPDGGPDAAVGQQESPERLAPGALRGQVEDHLREAPAGKEFTPHDIGKALGRSSGAVHNALVKLTDLGTARQTCARPKKFTLATGE
ncbi:hypothetical protein [Nocardia wallacei]|uniref:hypothetical protein n=1 Tax=Nocardia wallacei TaxID=480035 RepID=UPI002458FDA9|nr:hypothetical protein [Nocardia wallacei]